MGNISQDCDSPLKNEEEVDEGGMKLEDIKKPAQAI